MIQIKIIVLLNNQILVSQIEEVSSELGDPDCKLIQPFIISKDQTLSPWLCDISSNSTFMMHSDKILTITEPKPDLLKKYQDLIN